MKYRLDFVTNSSSSFIFGKPNENTITTEGVWEFVKDSAIKLLSISTRLTFCRIRLLVDVANSCDWTGQ